MPWKEMCLVEQRFEFVLAVEKGEFTVAALCRKYGISRQTGYKWLRRYREEPSPEYLVDRSRRPHKSPHHVEEDIEAVVLVARKRYPHWGPRKLRAWLEREFPSQRWPSPATFGRILKRRGLVRPPRRRCRTPPYTRPFADVTAPNQVWCVDFKGHFRTADGTCVYPLTMTDAFSRFVLCCQVVLHPRSAEVRDHFEWVFREFGLPAAIRSDNGAPFASTGPGGLTDLSAWWVELGIRHERIDPGKPQQNGRHERMHLTLKRETASPPAATPRGQQGRFDRWRKEFNDDRPHQALRFKTPADLYVPSARSFDKTSFTRDHYPFSLEYVLVDKHGCTRWRDRKVLVGRALRHQLVEFRPLARRRWLVCFGPVELGVHDERSSGRKLLPALVRKRRIPNGAGDALRAFRVDGRRRPPTRKPPSPDTTLADQDQNQNQKIGVSTMS